MKIVILTKHMFPEQTPRAFRVHELAQEFVQMGHEVVIYCDDTGYNYESYTRLFGIRVLSLRMKRYNINLKAGIFSRALRFFLRYFFQYPDVKFLYSVFRALKKEKDIELLISNAMPHSIHWGVAVTKMFSKKKDFAKFWICENGDPFYLNPTVNCAFYFKYFEMISFSLCDKITVPVVSAKDGYYKRFYDKIAVIPQGFRINKLKSSYVKNDVITFIYAGGFYPGIRNPIKLFDYLNSLETNFKFIIYTDQVNRKIIESFLGDRFIWRDYIKREDLLEELTKADFLLNISNNSTSQVPSKLIDYAIANRPIISIQPDNIDYKLLNNFLNYEFNDNVEINVEDYNIVNVAKKFLKLIESNE